MTVNFGKDVNLNNIKSLKLYYSGTEALQDRGKGRFAPVEYISSHNPGKTLSANPSYSVMKSEVTKIKNTIVLEGKRQAETFPWSKLFLG